MGPIWSSKRAGRYRSEEEPFRAGGLFCGEDTILATNTSSISIPIWRSQSSAAIASSASIFSSAACDEADRDRVRQADLQRNGCRSRTVAEAMGKTAIVVRDSPGFATSASRRHRLEAIRMLEEGVASAEDIDKAWSLGTTIRWVLSADRPDRLDVRLAIADTCPRRLSCVFDPPELLRRMVADGKLGKKTGEASTVGRRKRMTAAERTARSPMRTTRPSAIAISAPCGDCLRRYWTVIPAKSIQHLDVACGIRTGHAVLRKPRLHLAASDISSVMLNVARKRAKWLVAGDTRALHFVNVLAASPVSTIR